MTATWLPDTPACAVDPSLGDGSHGRDGGRLLMQPKWTLQPAERAADWGVSTLRDVGGLQARNGSGRLRQQAHAACC